MANEKTVVGSVRPSQLLWTYGPGALVDLPNLSVITSGTDIWQKERCAVITEARLLAAVQQRLGRRSNRYAWHRSARAKPPTGSPPKPGSAYQFVPSRAGCAA